MDKLAFLGFSEPFSSFTHLLSSFMFLIFGVYLIWKGRGNPLRTFGNIVYIFCGVFLFAMSGVYHLLEKGTSANYVLQILDHAGIYLMICGTLTPFQIILLRGWKRWFPILVIWSLGITGLTLSAVFFDSMPEWFQLSVFISLGWISIFSVNFFRKIDMITVKRIALGGVLYTIGAVFDFTKWPVIYNQVIDAHDVFHIFVSLAAAIHFYAILKVCDKPISTIVVVKVKQRPDQLFAFIKNENANFYAVTREDLDFKLKAWIQSRYYKNYIPDTIKLKFAKEDFLKV